MLTQMVSWVSMVSQEKTNWPIGCGQNNVVFLFPGYAPRRLGEGWGVISHILVPIYCRDVLPDRIQLFSGPLSQPGY